MTKPNQKTVHILIGPPGSGKTYWSKNVLMKHREDIIRVSQDDQGRHGHRELFTKCINEGKSVVVDRMNFNFDQRRRYIEQVSGKGYRIIFVLFNLVRETCLSRMKTRKDHPTISVDTDHNAILDFYFNNFEPPSLNDYHELITIGENKRANTLDLRNICLKKRVIVIGDIHGCFDELMSLLDKCEYRVGDIVVATGDLVDRGPKIMETLLWFKDTPAAYSVEGNHDNKFKRYLNGNPVKVSNGLDCSIRQCVDADNILWNAWLSMLPKMIRLSDWGNHPVYVVHAGVDARNPIEDQRTETCLYVRFLNGKDFFDTEGGTPWWETLDGSYTVLSGHIINEDAHPHQYAYCLDGGVCQGGKLRALIINGDERQIVEVKCNSL